VGEREIWGTFSVKDHCLPNTFVREVLLFDRLVLPVPDTAEEQRRWEHPNAADLGETWDPEQLDTLIKILGSQHIPAQPARNADSNHPGSVEDLRTLAHQGDN